MSGKSTARARALLSFAAVLPLLSSRTAAQAPDPIRATWNYDQVHDRHQFSLKFDDYLVVPADAPLVESDFRLWALRGDESRRPVPFELIAEPGTAESEEIEDPAGALAGLALYPQVQFVPEFLPEEGESYAVETVRAPIRVFDGSAVVDVEEVEEEVANPEDLELNKGYVRPKPEAPHLAISAGDQQGVVAFRARYGLDDLSGKSWLHLDLDFRGDFALQSDSRDEYFDNLSGELRAFSAARHSLFGSFERYFQYGVHYRFESDAAFDNADHNLGLDLATYTKDPISAAVAGLFVPGDQAVVTPLLRVEANYVKEAEATDANKPDTSDGIWRASANLDWHLPLGRELEWNFLPAVGSISELDLLLEAKGTFDFDRDEFLDQSKAILRFTRAGENDSNVSFDITFASGESAPLYEQVNALLFGLNMEI